MAYLSYTHFFSLPAGLAFIILKLSTLKKSRWQLLSIICRWQSRGTLFPNVKSLESNHLGLKGRWHLAAVSKREVTEELAQEVSEVGDVVEKKTRQTSKRATARIRRKGETENAENGSVSVVDGNQIHKENKTASELSDQRTPADRLGRKMHWLLIPQWKKQQRRR